MRVVMNEGPDMKRYISAAQLAERYAVNRSTIWRWAQRGLLPRPIRISEHCTRWDLDEVDRVDRERDQLDQGRRPARRQRRPEDAGRRREP